jgi:endonuclease/exonuclease/phosphatase family metal-dependent hydrolase
VVSFVELLAIPLSEIPHPLFSLILPGVSVPNRWAFHSHSTDSWRTVPPRPPRLRFHPWTGWIAALLLQVCLALTPCSLRADTVRIATLNLRNYLLVDRMVEGVYRPKYPKPESEKRALHKIIAEVGPDILAVQEIGGEAFVFELQKDLAALGCDYPHTALMAGVDKERHTALLSRIAFRVIDMPVIDFPYFERREPVKRGLLGVVFAVSGVEWSLFNVHLKSRWTETPDDPQSRIRREGESRAIRNYLKLRFPEPGKAQFIVTGDFNATRDKLAVRQFLRSGPTKLTLPVPAADSRGETWTYLYGRADTYSRVDFILASPPLFEIISGGRGSVYDGTEALQASDHRLVFADLVFPRSDGGGKQER